MSSDRSGILPNSPLVYTLASVRFATWPLLEKNLPEIQDDLRELAPLIHNIEFLESTRRAWMLLSSDRTLGIQLASDQLLILSSTYTRFSVFAEVLSRCLKAVLSRMRFMDVTGLGVRYVDHIRPEPNRTARDYISGSLLPPDFDGFEAAGGVVIASYKDEDAELRVRAVSQPGLPAVPEDLIGLLAMAQEPGNQLTLPIIKPSEVLLDMDSIMSFPKTRRMEVHDIEGRLDLLHTRANRFFRHSNVCTDLAFDLWKSGESID